MCHPVPLVLSASFLHFDVLNLGKVSGFLAEMGKGAGVQNLLGMQKVPRLIPFPGERERDALMGYQS